MKSRSLRRALMPLGWLAASAAVALAPLLVEPVSRFYDAARSELTVHWAIWSGQPFDDAMATDVIPNPLVYQRLPETLVELIETLCEDPAFPEQARRILQTPPLATPAGDAARVFAYGSENPLPPSLRHHPRSCPPDSDVIAARLMMILQRGERVDCTLLMFDWRRADHLGETHRPDGRPDMLCFVASGRTERWRLEYEIPLHVQALASQPRDTLARRRDDAADRAFAALQADDRSPRGRMFDQDQLKRIRRGAAENVVVTPAP